MGGKGVCVHLTLEIQKSSARSSFPSNIIHLLGLQDPSWISTKALVPTRASKANKKNKNKASSLNSHLSSGAHSNLLFLQMKFSNFFFFSSRCDVSLSSMEWGLNPWTQVKSLTYGHFWSSAPVSSLRFTFASRCLCRCKKTWVKQLKRVVYYHFSYENE